MSARHGRTVLVTGVTGFLGKVTLFELMRRREELDIDRVIVVVRGRGRRSAADRFRADVVTSPCFATLPAKWADDIEVLSGDLAKPDFGKQPGDQELLSTVTHVIHSAAAVSFTLPGAVAAAANITASLNLLDALQASRVLQRIVYVSTAYVTPHHTGRIREALVPLPAPAEELYARLVGSTATDEAIMAQTGHPNTYTMTKAIAEHLIASRRGSVPLSIVRPSIITASRRRPMPGWIDSVTGFGAFVTLIGLGHLRAVVGQADARLDLIPVDEVTRAVLDEMVSTAPDLSIRHSVAGKESAPAVGDCWNSIERYFRTHPVQRTPSRRYLGPRDSAFAVADLVHHRVPITLASLGTPASRRQGRKLVSRLAHVNAVFPYFTSRTFDFEHAPHEEPFDSRVYLDIVCRGVSHHLLGRGEDEWMLAGRAHPRPGGDVRWTGEQQPRRLIRFGVWLVTKTLRRITDTVTVDIPSFERARDAVPDGAAMVLTPSHRSFLDFVLCSYLSLARPDLRIRMPHVAAAIEFGRLPFLGHLLQSVNAFYLERGAVKANRDLATRVHKILHAGETLEFFIEGARSRTRAFLSPKRGLMRCLQTSERTCVLFPIAISYDRIPEEQVFARELAGAPKSSLGVKPLLRWIVAAWRGQVQLGRIHLACGTPIMVDADTNIQEAGDEVIRELRNAMAVTTFHIEASVMHEPNAAALAASIRTQIEATGKRVLESNLPVPETLAPVIAQTMREHYVALLSTADQAEKPMPVEAWREDRPASTAVA